MIDKIPVASLYPDRYTLGKTKVYEYMGILNIKPFRVGKAAFITFEQLKALDEYCRLLAENPAAAAEFAVSYAQSSSQGEQVRERNAPVHELVHTSADLSTSPAWLLFVEAIAARLQPPASDPLAPQRQLQEICEQGWTVSSSQLRQILGIAPKAGDRYGFTFTKAGRVGRQLAWRIGKITF
ncbi:hypothetical protein IQ268_09030 [Oculatella sp. LEGE 06141]|uniref:hypothetical protein n=1 Tax=Oculatella sp. LEGE 06141 TaxID=1828648 RepID=UPI0019FBBEB2|nr:hypothetical protein [Oculatella sp. LEGE 06141]